MRITESAPLAADSADFTLPNPGTNSGDQPYWVIGGDAATRKINAENCAKEQCRNMLAASGRTTVILSSSQVATR